VCSDSRSLRPGELFVALKGPRFDGHRYVEASLAQGAAAALVEEQALPVLPSGSPLLVVDSTREALGEIARGHRSRIQAPLTGVTGSAGKTTVKEMLADALGSLGPTGRTRGNWNNDLGLPLSLLATPEDVRHGVYELGMNRPGEIAALSHLLKPWMGLVTALGPAHLELFGSVDAVVDEKAQLLRALPGDGRAVFSADSPWFERLRRAAPCPIVTVSQQGRGDYWTEPAPGKGSFAVVERDSGARCCFTPSQPGRYMVGNILLVVAAARQFGAEWSSLQAAVCTYVPQPMRWETTVVHGVQVVNDAYNANPLSMREALQAFRELPVAGGRWLVLGGMHELGAESQSMHQLMGRELAGTNWAGLVTVGEMGRDLADGARQGGFPPGRVHPAADCLEAAHCLRRHVRPGDAVLLKASRAERLETILPSWARQANAGGAPESREAGAPPKKAVG
jgi:UDP-N-acetylmuramoyl-tripeptide--D-alanyl-D-alanine ligase